VRIVYDIFAYFPCNSCGVRIGVRRTPETAERYMNAFSKRNKVATGWRTRFERTK
jgi:hypothetical protein